MNSKTSDTHLQESRAKILCSLIDHYGDKEMWTSAEDAAIKALEIHRRLGGENSEMVGRLEFKLAVFLSYQDKFDTAEVHMQKALNNYTWAGQKTEEIADAYLSLGGILAGKGRYDEAEELYKKSLKIFEHHFGGLDNPKVASCFSNLGNFYSKQMRLEETENHFKKAIEILKHFPYKQSLAMTYWNLITIYLTCDNCSKAEEMFYKCQKILPSSHRQDKQFHKNKKLATAYWKIFMNSHKNKNYSRAEEMFDKCQQTLPILHMQDDSGRYSTLRR